MLVNNFSRGRGKTRTPKLASWRPGKGGRTTLVGPAFGVNSGQSPAELGLDLAPMSVGPSRGRDPAAALRPGPVQEKLANIT